MVTEEIKKVLTSYPELEFVTTFLVRNAKVLVVKLRVKRGFRFSEANQQKALLQWVGELVGEHKTAEVKQLDGGCSLVYVAADRKTFKHLTV